MNQKITHQETRGFFSVIDTNKDIKKLNPGKQVVFLVRQFAYAYHVEKKLPQTLNRIILN
ncbi:MAG: hypothetical protein LBR97_03840 [Dysgonamonadaceae bacterium]|jgi:hypothetical protein|nr:hypothetical protein [Dysgonamonadaceae bacterium]